MQVLARADRIAGAAIILELPLLYAAEPGTRTEPPP